jgi:hypothetical protein
MSSISEILQSATSYFSLNEALQIYQPLGIFVLGMIIYSIFIFKFYRFVARRDLFKYSEEEESEKRWFERFLGNIGYIFKHIFVLPILIFFWFLVLSAILAFLSKQEGAQMVLLISIALIATIRVVSYYNEDLSKDLAKMLPFALLGIFLVDISFFSAETSLNALKEIPGLWNILVYYLIFLIFLEVILRLFFNAYKQLSKNKNNEVN